jgi:hypothetical protein
MVFMMLSRQGGHQARRSERPAAALLRGRRRGAAQLGAQVPAAPG